METCAKCRNKIRKQRHKPRERYQAISPPSCHHASVIKWSYNGQEAVDSHCTKTGRRGIDHQHCNIIRDATIATWLQQVTYEMGGKKTGSNSKIGQCE